MTEAPLSLPGSQAVAAVILAAGQSSRFGRDKRHALLPNGSSLLEAVVQTHRVVLGTVWVVTRPQDDFARSICQAHGARQLICHDADQGMGRSLAAGIAAAMAEPHGFQALMVSLADMPGVAPNTLSALIARFQATGQAVLPRHARTGTPSAGPGELGHPRILPRACWPAMVALRGDEGARHALDWSLAQQVDVVDEGVLLDVDYPEDLARFAG